MLITYASLNKLFQLYLLH
ncbi:hypothetical protein Gohar_022245, partial [Gossypium harknessii]|nr:hypothetical protein [Gossypium harknessii]